MNDHPDTSESRRYGESLRQIARLAHRLAGSAGVTLSLFEDGVQHVIGASGVAGAPFAGAALEADQTLCGVVVSTGRPLVCGDTRNDPGVADHVAVIEGGVRAYLGFPLRDLDDTVLGTLCAWESEPRQWDAELLSDLRDLAGAASTQLAFARLARERAESERALLAQRAFDTAVLDSLGEGVAACDDQGRLSLFNRALRDIHGARERDDVEWAPTYQLYTVDGERLLDPDEVPLARAFAGEHVVDEPMAVAHDGTLRKFLATGTQLTDDAGNRIGAVVAMRDVTDERRRRRFDAAQLDAATRLAHGPTGDAVSLVLDVLQVAFRSSDVGYVPAETETGDGNTEAQNADAVVDAARTGLVASATLGAGRAELAAPVRVAGRPAGVLRIRGEAGELLDDQAASLVIALAGMVSRQLELAHVRELSGDLHRTQAELERVVGQIEDFVFSIEVLPDGRVVPLLVGSSAGVLGGELDPDDEWRKFFDTRVPAEDYAELKAWRVALQAGRAAQMTCRFLGLDGETRWVWTRSKPRREGDRLFVDGISTNVTDRHRLDLEREQLLREQARQVEELKALDAAKSEFVATVAHEIRGPLGMLVTFADHALEALDEDGGPLGRSMGTGLPAARRSAGLAARTAGHLQNVVANLFDLARYDAGALAPDLDDVDVFALLGEVRRVALPGADAKQLTLRFSGGARPVVIRADATKLRQAADNILGNAIKFTPAGGSVELSCAVLDEGTVEIRIADTGIGIPPEDVPHLFSRFYRASNARTSQTPGTGLGLALARSIVEAHDGTVSVTPNPTGGTVVALRLPVV